MTTRTYKTRHLFAVLLLLLFYSKRVNGQQQKNFDFRAKAYPFALISIPRPTVQAGIELRYKKIGVDLSYGQQWAFLFSSNPDTVRVKNFGNRYGADLRYYLKHLKSNNLSDAFVSIGYSKVYSTQNLTTHWFSGSKFEPSLARVNMIQVFSANLGICEYYKRFLFEGILGTGIRFRTVQNVDSRGTMLEEEKNILPHLSMVVRIGYVISI